MQILKTFFLYLCCFLFLADESSGCSNFPLLADAPSQGVRNAILRAYQMTDICFTPVNSFVGNPRKTYSGGEQYQGLVYSSVKEKSMMIGMDVSFHTFMTALHNPRSVMYTENVSKPPYHGRNCGAYYGTVCSGLVSYALGQKIYLKSYDYAKADCFELVKEQSSRGVRLADVINSGGHVQLVTKIWRNPETGKAVEMEICEGVRPGCRRAKLTGDRLDELIARKGRKIYRYKFVDSVKYQPLTAFVALEGEKRTAFRYNDDICTSRGDKACYTINDSIVLNILRDCQSVEVFKDSALYQTIQRDGGSDVVLRRLPYGDYKARTVNGAQKSGFTSWKVIDTHVLYDKETRRVSFHSANAQPVYLEFSTRGGGRPTTGVFELSSDDIKRGWIDVSSYVSKGDKAKAKFIKVHFECDYGRVINKPVRWK